MTTFFRNGVSKRHLLRKNVTSPNGTTQAGLEILMDQKSGLMPLVKKTVEAAAERSKELGDG